MVGVVENVKAVGLDQAPPRIVYRPFRQSSEKLLTIGNVQRSVALRAEGDLAVLAPALRHTVRVHDPNAAVLFLGSMSSVIAESVAGERAVGLLLALFAGSALLLGAIGLYGVLEHAVREERRELSIRLALGASSRELFLGVLRRGLGLGLVGTAFGLILATAMAGTLEALVFEVEPAAPGLLAAAAGILLLVAILAATIPAWHASNSDPIAALRSE